MRRTLAAALVLFCAWTGIPQAQTTTSRVDSTPVGAPRWDDTVFHTHRTRDIKATLHWLNADADLRLYLARRSRSGRWRRWRGPSAVPTPRTCCCARPGPAATGCATATA